MDVRKTIDPKNAMRIFTHLVVPFPMFLSLNKLCVAVIALIFCMVNAPAVAQIVEWPDLPQKCFVSQRPATMEDVSEGCAAFLIGGPKRSIGTPLNIQIPEYAYHIDSASGKKTPVILLQAEEHSGIKAVGYREVGTSILGAALLSEMQLLGGSKPR